MRIFIIFASLELKKAFCHETDYIYPGFLFNAPDDHH